jgi:hypothetical protein
MSYEPNPYVEPEQMPKPTRRFGRLPRAALTGGVAVGLALGGAGLAFAASGGGSSPSQVPAGATAASPPSTSVPGPAPKVGKPRFGRPFGPGGFAAGGLGGMAGLGGLGKVVHGQATVRSGTGYKTVEFQLGQVTSVSSNSITVRSPDGYTHTYSVLPTTVVDAQAGGISSVAGKDQVQIISNQASGKDTATNVLDTTKLKSSRTSFGFGSGPNGPRLPGAGGPGSPASAKSPPQ